MTDFTSTPFTRQFVADCQALRKSIENTTYMSIVPPAPNNGLPEFVKDNLTREYPAEFLQLWDGCSHLDCLPQCNLGMEGGYCERLERAFADYDNAMEAADNGRNTGGKSYR